MVTIQREPASLRKLKSMDCRARLSSPLLSSPLHLDKKNLIICLASFNRRNLVFSPPPLWLTQLFILARKAGRKEGRHIGLAPTHLVSLSLSLWASVYRDWRLSRIQSPHGGCIAATAEFGCFQGFEDSWMSIYKTSCGSKRCHL